MRTILKSATMIAAAVLTACGGCAQHTPVALPPPSDRDETVVAGNPPESVRQGDAYYLSTCARCGQELGFKGPTIRVMRSGREVLFCCEQCRQQAQAAWPELLAALDARIARDQTPLYPLETSLVSGMPLTAHPVDWVWNNRLIRLNDQGEVARFLREPRVYIRRLDAAVVRAQGPGYSIGKCVVQGDALDEENSVETVVANRLVRLCCMDCVRRVQREPRLYLPLVDFARRHSGPPAGQPPNP